MPLTSGRTDRTRRGILLLGIGAVTWWIPGVYVYGAVIGIVGLALVYMDRSTYGTRHSTNARRALLLGVLGYVIGIVAAMVIDVSLMWALAIPSSTDPRGISVTFAGFAASVAVETALAGLAPVLITVSLQSRTGKGLLWSAYIANCVLQGWIIAMEANALPGYIAGLAQPGGSFSTASAFGAFISQYGWMQWTGAVPALLEAGAFFFLLTGTQLSRTQPDVESSSTRRRRAETKEG